MSMQHLGSTEAMVAYHQERLAASMRAAESDRAMILQLRASLGATLIALGERLRGECSLDRMVPPPQPRQAG